MSTSTYDDALASTAALAAWQGILDRHDELFTEADARMRMALVPRHRSDANGVTRSVVQRHTDPVRMLTWEHDGTGMRAKAALFCGLDTLQADLLFVGNEGAFEAVLDRHCDQALGELKRRINGGAIQLFVLRSKSELRELGYEDFLDHLGLPFLGACR